MPPSNADHTGRAWTSQAKAIDVRNAYRLFLGRPVESLESVTVKSQMTVKSMVVELLCCDEFVQSVEEPLLETGCVKPWLYDGFPRPRLLAWAAETLPVDGGKRRLRQAQTWKEALNIIYTNPAFLKNLSLGKRLSQLTEIGEVLSSNSAGAIAQAAR